MTTYPVPLPSLPRDEHQTILHKLWLAASSVRPCVIDWDAMALVFEADLTAPELAALDALVTATRSPFPPGEYDRIRPALQVLRDLRQLGRAPFLALTAAERDRQLYDAQTATTIILLALLRD